MQGQRGPAECVREVNVFRFTVGVGRMHSERGRGGYNTHRCSVECARGANVFKLVVKMR